MSAWINFGDTSVERAVTLSDILSRLEITKREAYRTFRKAWKSEWLNSNEVLTRQFVKEKQWAYEIALHNAHDILFSERCPLPDDLAEEFTASYMSNPEVVAAVTELYPAEVKRAMDLHAEFWRQSRRTKYPGE